MCGALWVLSAGSAASEGTRKINSKGQGTGTCVCMEPGFSTHGCFPSLSSRVRTGGAA